MLKKDCNYNVKINNIYKLNDTLTDITTKAVNIDQRGIIII